jgi:methionyl-tRNA formyltransferase
MSDRIDLTGVEHWLLMGGGSLLLAMAALLAERKVSFVIAAGTRHLAEAMDDGDSFRSVVERNGWPYWEVADIHADTRVADWISRPTVGLSLGAPWVIRQELIERFGRRLFNSHGARLPRDRGAGGFSWRILRGDRLGYSVLHELTSGVDKGGVVKLQEYLFPPGCRTPADYQTYARERDYSMLASLVDDVETGRSLDVRSQPEYLSAYWPRLHTQTNGAIDWRWTLADIERFINAFDRPFAGAFTLMNGERRHLRACQTTTDDGAFHPFQRGLVYRKSEIGLFIAVDGGGLIVSEVLDSQGKNVTPSVRLGDRFHTPENLLAEALCFRAQFTATGLQGVGLVLK